MKRREFLTLFTCSVASISFFSGFHFLGVEESTTEKPLVLRACDAGNEFVANGDIILPKNPNLYSTIYYIEVPEGKLPKIIGNFNNSQISKPGKYVLQYLGDYYGWSIV